MAIRSTRARIAPSKTPAGDASIAGAESTIAVQRRRYARWMLNGCLCLATLSSMGCTIISNAPRIFDHSQNVDDFMISYRNRAMAEKAWICYRERVGCDQYHRECKDGFISGYMDVASGGAGCCPTLAPRRYWGWKYQSPGGHAAVSAWFACFPKGVQAAEEDGLGNWNQIHTGGANLAPNPMAYPAANEFTPVPAVANPFYSEQESVPNVDAMPGDAMPGDAMPGDAMPGDAMPGVSPTPMIEIEEMFDDSAFNDSATTLPADDSASQQLAVETSSQGLDAGYEASFDDQEEVFTEPAEVVIDDIFGTAATVNTEAESDELPFTFE